MVPPNLPVNVYSGSVHNHQKLEPTPTSFRWRVVSGALANRIPPATKLSKLLMCRHVYTPHRHGTQVIATGYILNSPVSVIFSRRLSYSDGSWGGEGWCKGTGGRFGWDLYYPSLWGYRNTGVYSYWHLHVSKSQKYLWDLNFYITFQLVRLK